MSQMTHECFADEIAIDFPSIAPAVDRVRETFVSSDEYAVPLETEIALTPRQAKRLAPTLGFPPDAAPRDLDARQWAAVYSFTRG